MKGFQSFGRSHVLCDMCWGLIVNFGTEESRLLSVKKLTGDSIVVCFSMQCVPFRSKRCMTLRPQRTTNWHSKQEKSLVSLTTGNHSNVSCVATCQVVNNKCILFLEVYFRIKRPHYSLIIITYICWCNKIRENSNIDYQQFSVIYINRELVCILLLSFVITLSFSFVITLLFFLLPCYLYYNEHLILIKFSQSLYVHLYMGKKSH